MSYSKSMPIFFNTPDLVVPISEVWIEVKSDLEYLIVNLQQGRN